VAKKDPEQQIKYYEIVREHSLALTHKAEEAIQQMKAFGDDFTDVFEKTRKRHDSLLNKIAKLTERERKKDEASPKVAVKKAKKAKPLASKAKPSAAEPGSASKPEANG